MLILRNKLYFCKDLNVRTVRMKEESRSNAVLPQPEERGGGALQPMFPPPHGYLHCAAG
jgi:hypothetical protein